MFLPEGLSLQQVIDADIFSITWTKDNAVELTPTNNNPYRNDFITTIRTYQAYLSLTAQNSNGAAMNGVIDVASGANHPDYSQLSTKIHSYATTCTYASISGSSEDQTIYLWWA